jgi:UDP-N-acetylmuramate--alanine ligase
MKIFFVGIGGIGMSAVAQIFQAKGDEVSGSDSSISELTQSLKDKGINVYDKQIAENIDESFDLLIYSEAIPENNPERQEAKALEIRQMNYAEALGTISKEKKTIAITGTHGKTTVTGMLTSILLAAQADPTIVIGSKIDHLDNLNFRVGESDLFLTEACEYRDNYHHLSPDVILINNLEPDHLDYFKTDENYYKSFQIMIEKIPETGTLIVFEKDAKHLEIKNTKGKVIRVSEEQCGVSPCVLKVPGQHNKRNALAAAEVSKSLGISDEVIRRGLEDFHGTWRRFEFKGKVKGAKVYDDYGHHPTEIKATLQGAREWFPDKRLILVFQPHQYSRTRALFSEFAGSFGAASETWITDIYEARDSKEDKAATSAEKLAEAITDSNSKYVPFEQLSSEITKTADPNTVFLVMGAGNINRVLSNLNYDAS